MGPVQITRRVAEKPIPPSVAAILAGASAADAARALLKSEPIVWAFGEAATGADHATRAIGGETTRLRRGPRLQVAEAMRAVVSAPAFVDIMRVFAPPARGRLFRALG